jgi:hypothetical protein
LIRLPFIAGGLAIVLAARFLSRRRARTLVRLRDGRQVRLLSSVALIDGSASDLLALEYSSSLTDPDPAAVRLEARNLAQTLGARSEYARCTRALVTARPVGDRAGSHEELIFAFRRNDAGADWFPTEGLE